MLSLFFFWLYVFWLCLAFGLGAKAAWAALSKQAPGPSEARSLDLTLLLGFGIIAVLASYLSIVMPMGLGANAVFIAAGLALTVWRFSELRQIKRLLTDGFRALYWPFQVLIPIVFIVALLAGVGEVDLNDSKIYHTPAIQWAKEYAVVPGLGNLHGRLAFNSHFFIVSALFSYQWSEQLILYPLNSFLFLVLSLRLLINIDAAVKQGAASRWVLNALLLVLFVYYSINYINTPSTDVISCILVLYCFLLFTGIAERREGSLSLMALALLVFVGVTFKVSTVFIALLLLYYAFPLRSRRWLSFAAIGALALLPFFWRNVVLSGYLLYPFPAIDLFDPEWKLPAEQAVFEKDLVKAWARQDLKKLPEEEVVARYAKQEISKWFGPWLGNYGWTWKSIYAVNLLSLIPFLLSLYRRDYYIAMALGTIWAALAFWFANGPDPRFAQGFLFFGFALSISYGVFLLRPSLGYRQGTLALAAGLMLVAVLGFKRKAIVPKSWTPTVLVYPLPYPDAPTTTFEGWNFKMEIAPAETRFCGTTPLPCTPYPKKNLAMRGDSFQQGFILVEE